MTTDRIVCVPALDTPTGFIRKYDANKTETHGCGCAYDPDSPGLTGSAAAKSRLRGELMPLKFEQLQERAMVNGMVSALPQSPPQCDLQDGF